MWASSLSFVWFSLTHDANLCKCISTHIVTAFLSINTSSSPLALRYHPNPIGSLQSGATITTLWALWMIIPLDSVSMSSLQGYQKDLKWCKFRRRVNIEKHAGLHQQFTSGKRPEASALTLAHIIAWRLKLPSASCGQFYTNPLEKQHIMV